MYRYDQQASLPWLCVLGEVLNLLHLLSCGHEAHLKPSKRYRYFVPISEPKPTI